MELGVLTIIYRNRAEKVLGKLRAWRGSGHVAGTSAGLKRAASDQLPMKT